MKRQVRTYAVSFWYDDEVRPVNDEEVQPVIKWVPSYYYADDVNDVFNQFVCTHRERLYFSVHEVTAGDIRRINRLSRELLKRNKDDRRVEYKIQHPGAEAIDEPIYQNALFAAMDAVCNHAESIAVLQYVPALGFVPYDVVFPELIRS